MSVRNLPASPFVQVRSENFDGAILPFPRIFRQDGHAGGTRAANIAMQESEKAMASGVPIRMNDLRHEDPVWAMVVSHQSAMTASAWRAGFSFRDYSHPIISWFQADAGAIRGRCFTLCTAEPRIDIACALVIHADDQNVFTKVSADDPTITHVTLHNELWRRRTSVA